jgi:hypothetical protein
MHVYFENELIKFYDFIKPCSLEGVDARWHLSA